MRAEEFIAGLLILNAIQLVILFFVYYWHQRRYKRMEGRFIIYLTSLDKENERLATGEEPKQARRDYRKLIK